SQARGSGRSLDLDTYRRLEKPSEKVPTIRFGAVPGDLFRRILERCVEPGTPCMSTIMKHDRRGGGDPHDVRPGAGNPPGRTSMPQHGKPEGALFKSPQEKGSGPNVTKPADPNKASGSTKPGAPENRNMTAIHPVRAPYGRRDATA
ncbi:MAG: COX aromatic rich motif-containing protein, partial [Sphingomonas bacterium]|nr:COX aromatic rich motif-containing protein [Sphingomonas bacterium]